jgi:hypothetical protein
MCHKHIPKEYPRREIIRISRPNVFGSYFTVSFSTNGLAKRPAYALNQALLHLAVHEKCRDSGRCVPGATPIP